MYYLYIFLYKTTFVGLFLWRFMEIWRYFLSGCVYLTVIFPQTLQKNGKIPFYTTHQIVFSISFSFWKKCLLGPSVCCCDLGRLLATPAAQLFHRIALHHYCEDFVIYCFFGGTHFAVFFVRKSAWKVKFCETLPSENIYCTLTLEGGCGGI